jgi:hypothetical protein
MHQHGDLREVMNADRRRQFGGSGRLLALMCECADAECRRTVMLSPEEYDALRPAPILHPEHLNEKASAQAEALSEAHTGFEPVPPP